MNAGRSIRPLALSVGDVAQCEVLLELAPLGLGRLAVFGDRPHPPAVGDECLVGTDHLVGVDGGVAARGVQVAVPEDGRGDVDR
jgi:hypothetical protein